jgi:hypothetical protein
MLKKGVEKPMRKRLQLTYKKRKVKKKEEGLSYVSTKMMKWLKNILRALLMT